MPRVFSIWTVSAKYHFVLLFMKPFCVSTWKKPHHSAVRLWSTPCYSVIVIDCLFFVLLMFPISYEDFALVVKTYYDFRQYKIKCVMILLNFENLDCSRWYNGKIPNAYQIYWSRVRILVCAWWWELPFYSSVKYSLSLSLSISCRAPAIYRLGINLTIDGK